MHGDGDAAIQPPCTMKTTQPQPARAMTTTCLRASRRPTAPTRPHRPRVVMGTLPHSPCTTTDGPYSPHAMITWAVSPSAVRPPCSAAFGLCSRMPVLTLQLVSGFRCELHLDPVHDALAFLDVSGFHSELHLGPLDNAIHPTPTPALCAGTAHCFPLPLACHFSLPRYSSPSAADGDDVATQLAHSDAEMAIQPSCSDDNDTATACLCKTTTTWAQSPCAMTTSTGPPRDDNCAGPSLHETATTMAQSRFATMATCAQGHRATMTTSTQSPCATTTRCAQGHRAMTTVRGPEPP